MNNGFEMVMWCPFKVSLSLSMQPVARKMNRTKTRHRVSLCKNSASSNSRSDLQLVFPSRCLTPGDYWLHRAETFRRCEISLSWSRNSPHFMVSRRFITVFTKARHLYSSWATFIQSTVAFKQKYTPRKALHSKKKTVRHFLFLIRTSFFQENFAYVHTFLEGNIVTTFSHKIHLSI